MRHYKGTRRCADKCAAGPKACDTCARKMYDVAQIILYYIGMYITYVLAVVCSICIGIIRNTRVHNIIIILYVYNHERSIIGTNIVSHFGTKLSARWPRGTRMAFIVILHRRREKKKIRI